MSAADSRRALRISGAIARSGRSVFDPLDDRPDLFYPLPLLERRLKDTLMGLNLDYPIRTRGKIAKQEVCKGLGYLAPDAFPRTSPRLPGQDLDVSVQKADNFQVWNETISPTRRYAVLRPDAAGRVVAVRVVTGESLAVLDRTGTLTSKYQASRRAGRSGSTLVSNSDTANFRRVFNPHQRIPEGKLRQLSPSATPTRGLVLSVSSIHQRLLRLLGREIPDPGLDQERVRGELLQRLASDALGLGEYLNRGQWPDILCQAVEVKLQTARTIDLGLIPPDSNEPAQEVHSDIRHRDIRYAVFYGRRVSKEILLEDLVVSTGKDFFGEFQRFEGRIQNTKLQLRLPPGFFDETE